MQQRVLKVHKDDNVLVALTNLKMGEIIHYDGVDYQLQEDIPGKHKFFIEDLQPGDPIHMYGVLVGKAQSFIPMGGLMTTANVKHAADPFEYRPYQYTWTAPDVSKWAGRTFNGYHRNDGRVGTANYWLFIPTVFCENRNLDVIREALYNQLGYEVSDRYKQKTRMLLDFYKSGIDIVDADLSIKESIVPTTRVFKNVDGIKFFKPPGRLRWYPAGCGRIK